MQALYWRPMRRSEIKPEAEQEQERLESEMGKGQQGLEKASPRLLWFNHVGKDLSP